MEKRDVKAAIYVRVSTDKQDNENQRRDLQAFCDARGWTVVEVYEDTAGGDDPGRNAFNRMLHDARLRRWDVLVFWAWDRLTRRGIEVTFRIMKQLQATGVAWESLKEPYLSSGSDPVIRDLLLSVIAWVAKQERQRISERTKAGLERARRKGKRLGRPPGSKDRRPRVRRWFKRPVDLDE